MLYVQKFWLRFCFTPGLRCRWNGPLSYDFVCPLARIAKKEYEGNHSPEKYTHQKKCVYERHHGRLSLDHPVERADRLAAGGICIGAAGLKPQLRLMQECLHFEIAWLNVFDQTILMKL